MAVIEITCPHCSARTYVTFVRQTGNGSCPECGNEITNVFQFSSNATSGTGTLLTEDFAPGGATLVPGAADSGDGQDVYGDGPPASLPLLDPSSAPSLVPRTSAPSLELSQSGPSLMPFDGGNVGDSPDNSPLFVPTESAPMLVPSNSAPTLIPSESSASARVEGVLLTPPPPRLRQFAAEDSSSTRTRRPTAEINLEEQPAVEALEDSPTRPTLPPVPANLPPSTPQSKAGVRRPTGSIGSAPQVQNEGEPGPQVVAKAPTSRVQKPPTGSIAKPPVAPRRSTVTLPQSQPKSLVAATRRPTSPLPSREITRPVASPPPPVKRPTAAVTATRKTTAAVEKAASLEDALAPAEELSLFTPPPPKAPAGARAVMPGPKRPTAPVAKAAPGTRAVPQSSADSGGRSYAPIRVPGGPPSPVSSPRPPAAPTRTPTRKLNLVGLGEAPRLESSEKPKNFAKPKFDPGLTRLGYTMPGSDVSHFDGLPEPSPVPYGATLPDGEIKDDAPPPPPPGPRPGTRAAMPRPSAPVPKPPVEDFDALAEEQGEDVPAAMVSRVEINEEWAPGGPDSGVMSGVEIPDDLDDEVSDSAATTVPETSEAGEDEEPAEEFEAEAETRPLLKQEKPKKTKARPAADDEPRRVYASRPSFDWEKFRYHLFVGSIYTVCALALIAFVLGLYHVHVKPLF